jgi:predicted DNA-binding transcriptional regulator AlpA
MPEDIRIIRRAEIESRFGMTRSLLYREVASGNFPAPIKLTSAKGRSGASGWLESEVLDYFRQRIAESRAGAVPGISPSA